MAGEHVWPKTDGDIDYASEGNGEVGGVITVEAGENITAGEVVYIHLTDGKAYVSDASTKNDYRASGIAHNTANTGADCYVRTRGIYYSAAAFTDKEDYYLGTEGVTNGLSTTVSAVRIGTAISTNELYVNIVQDDKDVLGTIKAWLPNHAGMPAAVANLTAFWKLCDGSVINDTESPLNFAGAGQAPDLNGSVGAQRFLRGDTTSDDGTDNTAGGTETHSHSYSCTTLSHSVNYGGSRNNYCGGGSTGSTATLPSYIEVVFIMKIK